MATIHHNFRIAVDVSYTGMDADRAKDATRQLAQFLSAQARVFIAPLVSSEQPRMSMIATVKMEKLDPEFRDEEEPTPG